MRLLASTVFLALLAACTVTTTGAPCSSDLNCPSDQGCGNDGKCGTAALACPGHTIAGQCIPGTSCLGVELATCTAAGGVCSTGPVTTPCPAHQQCTSSASAASCECVSTRCSPATSSFCSAGGQVVTCAQDAPPATGCWYEASSAACGDPGAACVENAGSGSAACLCPTVNACTTLDATQCGATGEQVLRCKPVVGGSACLTWQVETDCATSSLVCSAGACVCPANPRAGVRGGRGERVAGGGPAESHRARITRGVPLPDADRRADLGESARLRSDGPGQGMVGLGPGGVVVFSEPGALSIGAGVTVTTDDAVPAIGHYAISTAAALTGAFVTVGPGSSVSGFEIRNEASTGAGVVTSCPTAADIGPVTLSAVAISAASSGTSCRSLRERGACHRLLPCLDERSDHRRCGHGHPGGGGGADDDDRRGRDWEWNGSSNRRGGSGGAQLLGDRDGIPVEHRRRCLRRARDAVQRRVPVREQRDACACAAGGRRGGERDGPEQQRHREDDRSDELGVPAAGDGKRVDVSSDRK